MRPIRVIGEPDVLQFRLPPELDGFYLLSPFGFCRAGEYQMLLRLVNRAEDASKKVSRVHHATSNDGHVFDVGLEAIGPGHTEDPDADGCEDPTVAEDGDGYTVFYSGYNGRQNRSSMLAATGTSLLGLQKAGVVLTPDERYANPKEAALVATPCGFRMFFEYARDGASHIGVADSPRLSGPWTYGSSPIAQRPGAFDSWHLSPSSAIRRADGTHVLFYNGASREGSWRISYALLDESAAGVLERPQTPLVSPAFLDKGDSDIAFAASALIDPSHDVWLYYSIADRKPCRSRLDFDGAVADSSWHKIP